MQQEFFAAALDDPPGTGDPDLAKIHQGTGIGREHVILSVNHRISVLDERTPLVDGMLWTSYCDVQCPGDR